MRSRDLEDEKVKSRNAARTTHFHSYTEIEEFLVIFGKDIRSRDLEEEKSNYKHNGRNDPPRSP